MMNEIGNKITSEHLSRKAYLYIRQSTVKQIFEHGESGYLIIIVSVKIRRKRRQFDKGSMEKR